MSNLDPINPYFIIKQLEEEKAELEALVAKLRAELEEKNNE